MNYLVWLCGGIILSFLEMFTPGFFVIGVGVSSIVTALPAALHAPFWLQLIVFSVMLALFFSFLRPLILRISSKDVKSNVEALQEETGIVTETIDNAQSKGRVKVKGSDWKAWSVDGETIEKDTLVQIKDVKGVTLYVRRK